MPAYARLDAAMRALEHATRAFASGFFVEALTDDEQMRASAELYSRAARPPGGLWPWETRWFDARLPPPPARLLIGGCGTGREALALVQRGYDVDAFDPAPAAVEACRDAVPDARVWLGAYAALDEAAAQYDAVLMGWGSFTHLLDAGARAQTLAELDARCRRGPILGSVWLDGSVHAAPPTGRAGRWGRSAGRLVGRSRGAPSAPPGRQFAAWAGFAHTFTRDELSALTRGIGRTLIWEDDPSYPHFTLPAPAPGPARTDV